jgi:hypothetical protein
MPRVAPSAQGKAHNHHAQANAPTAPGTAAHYSANGNRTRTISPFPSAPSSNSTLP